MAAASLNHLWTHLQVRPVDGFSRFMAQTTRIRARMCLLGISLTLLPILGVKYPQNPIFGAWIGVFRAKRAKYWKFHFIETNASISTRFCTTIETIKWSSLVGPIKAQRIQDGGSRHFENYKNCDVSATVWPIFTRFGTLIHGGSPNRSTFKNLNFTNRRWRTAAILKTVASSHFCNLLTGFDKIWHGDACWSPAPDVKFKFLIFDNLIWPVSYTHLTLPTTPYV